MLVFGGRNQQCLALSDCWLFDTAENSWTEVFASSMIDLFIVMNVFLAVCDSIDFARVLGRFLFFRESYVLSYVCTFVRNR